LPNLGLHLGNSLSVHHGSILHVIDGLACELHEGLESVFQSGLRRRGRGLIGCLVCWCWLRWTTLMMNRLMKSGRVDYGLDEGAPLDSVVGSTSTKNEGGFATQDCKSQKKVHWLVS